MTNQVEPQPQECWGLYDASGKLLGTARNEGEARRLAMNENPARHGWIWPQIKAALGWSIRRVRVEPVGVK